MKKLHGYNPNLVVIEPVTDFTNAQGGLVVEYEPEDVYDALMGYTTIYGDPPIAIDTSGSMPAEMLGEMIDEITNVMHGGGTELFPIHIIMGNDDAEEMPRPLRDRFETFVPVPGPADMTQTMREYLQQHEEAHRAFEPRVAAMPSYHSWHRVRSLIADWVNQRNPEEDDVPLGGH